MEHRSIIESFSETEMTNGFKEITAHYYQGNFGSFSKSDLEVLLFTILLNHCINTNRGIDDYTLSKILGITQSRVRTLKQKSQLQYPTDFSWEDSFVSCLKNAKYDDVKKLVKVSIPEVNVLIELRHFIEVHGWLDEYQLNPKLFQCPLDQFMLLCNELNGGCESIDAETKKKLRSLEKTLTSDQEKNSVKTIIEGDLKKGLHEFIKSGAKTGICALLKLIPCVGPAKIAFDWVIALLEK